MTAQRHGPVMCVDWFRVIADLTRRGLSTRSIGDEIAVPPATLLGWKQGAQPRHVDGERLIALWLRMMDKPRDELPMTSLLSGLHPPGQP